MEGPAAKSVLFVNVSAGPVLLHSRWLGSDEAPRESLAACGMVVCGNKPDLSMISLACSLRNLFIIQNIICLLFTSFYTNAARQTKLYCSGFNISNSNLLNPFVKRFLQVTLLHQ